MLLFYLYLKNCFTFDINSEGKRKRSTLFCCRLIKLQPTPPFSLKIRANFTEKILRKKL